VWPFFAGRNCKRFSIGGKGGVISGGGRSPHPGGGGDEKGKRGARGPHHAQVDERKLMAFGKEELPLLLLPVIKGRKIV